MLNASRNLKSLLAAAFIGLAVLTGLGKTGVLHPVPNVRVGGGAGRPRPHPNPARQGLALRKRAARQIRNLVQPGRGGFGPHWQAV